MMRISIKDKSWPELILAFICSVFECWVYSFCVTMFWNEILVNNLNIPNLRPLESVWQGFYILVMIEIFRKLLHKN